VSRALSEGASPWTARSVRLAATRRYGQLTGPAPIAPRATLCQSEARTPYTEFVQPMATDGVPRAGRAPASGGAPARPFGASAARPAATVKAATGQRRVIAP